MTDDDVREEPPLPRKLGHYEAVEKIGQGGMAVVYKGVQPSLNRPVAIKVLPQRFSRTEEMVERFNREASVVAQLNHPNIVQVIDRGKEGDTLFIVMEYVPSSSLDVMIRRHELSMEQIMDFSAQICDGLEYAHSKGVIHRDLKPSNILIDRESGRAKIADFGIAGIDTSGTGLSTLTTDGTAMGTLNYMSPEQRLDSHRVTHLTDVFSFGVLLYEMLTRKLPIGHFKLPSLLNQSAPIGLDMIVKRCLEESPNDRYRSAAEIKRDLERITTRHVSLKKAAAFTSRSVWRGKRRYVAAGVTVVAAAGVVLALSLRGADEVVANEPDSGAGADVMSVLNPGPGETEPKAQPVEPPIQPRPKPAPKPAPPKPQPKPQSKPVDTEAAAAAARAQADFARAQAMIGEGKRRAGIALLRQVVAKYGKSKLAPEAQYAIALAYDDMKEYGEAKGAYNVLLKVYPKSLRVPGALVGICRIDWRNLPLHGAANNQRDAESQEKLIATLRRVIARYPKSRTEAYRLIAEVAGRPDLNDWKSKADALMWLYSLDGSADADVLFGAGELYHRKVRNKKRAIAAYELFLKDFPEERRVGIVEARLATLQE